MSNNPVSNNSMPKSSVSPSLFSQYASTVLNSSNQTIQKQSASSKISSNFSNVLQQVQTPKTLDSIFEKASATYKVPVSLLKAVAKAESGYRADAVSSCGAQGIMQLMPQTSASLGVNDPFDPEENIMAGAKCLSQKLNAYNGDIKLTLASYNAGSGNVKKYGGIPPFNETKNYIEKVLTYMKTEDHASILSKNINTESTSDFSGIMNTLSTVSAPLNSDSSEALNSDDLSQVLDYASDSIDAIKTQARMMQYQSMIASISAFTSDETNSVQGLSDQSEAIDYTEEDYQRFLDVSNLTFY